MPEQLETLENKYKTLSSKLGSSATAYSSSKGIPTASDLSLDKQLSSVNKQIEDLKSKQTRSRWYGPSDVPTEDVASSDGLVVSGLKALQKPLNAIAGTAQYALGKGTKSGLAENINEATKTGLTFGNILQQEGVKNRPAQIGLGFALDVMFDPVNWATVGTSALIPRAGVGLIKGGAKGAGVKGALKAAGVGIVSNLEKKASTVMDLLPFSRKIARMTPTVAEDGAKLGFGDAYRNTMIKGATKYNELTDTIAKKAIVGGEKYDTLIGKNIYDDLGKGIYGQGTGALGDLAEKTIGKIPSVTVFGKSTPTGERIVDFFKYSPSDTAKMADLKDQAFALGKKEGFILQGGEKGVHFKSISDFESSGATVTIKQKVEEGIEGAFKDADGAFYVNKEIPIRDSSGKLLDKVEGLNGLIKVQDNFANAKYLLGASIDDTNIKHLVKAYKVIDPNKTGFQWFDDTINKLKNTTLGDIGKGKLGALTMESVEKEADDLVKNWNSMHAVKDMKPFNKLLTAYPVYISIFKAAKVPMNVASHVIANIGNFFMGAMMGLPVHKFAYYEEIRNASKLLKGKLGAEGLQKVFYNDAISFFDMMENNPNRFRQLTGLDPSDISDKLNVAKKLLGDKLDIKEEVLKFLQEGAESSEKELARRVTLFEKEASKAEREALKKRYPTGTETTKKLAGEGPITQTEMSTGVSGEISNDTVDKWKAIVSKKAAENPNNPIAQIADTLVNSMPRWYEQIDQSFKIGTTNFLMRTGLTEEELRIVKRAVDISKDDLLEPVVKGAEKLYRLKPLKASEVAMETYMNYAAMPDFVKMMRAIPFGSPFVSFPYAMAIKTGKTAIDNPAIFNKIGFMLNEINAGRTPQEKAALEEKYNKYLNSPTVIKMFGMWNTDVKNYIPYYTMQMFNPSERSYDNSTGGSAMKALDKLPIFQDPITNIIKNYWIQPWVLSGTGKTPQGQFGQPLYKTFDEKGNKIQTPYSEQLLSQGKEVVSSVVPGSLSYLGALNYPLGLSAETVDKIPLGYGFQNLANATQGRSSIGAMTKENAMQKTLRSLFGRSGIPAYTLDTTKTTSN